LRRHRRAALYEFLVADDVDAVLEQHAGDGVDEAAAVVTFHEQNLRVHALPP
jgi:hypothetical protein